MFEPIRVSAVPERAMALPGGQAAYALTVRNASSIVDRYRLAVAGLPEGWARLDQEALSLFPGASGRAQLTIAPPPGTQTPAGSYQFTVTATSEDDPSIRTELALALELSAVGTVNMDLLPAETEGRQGVFRLTVHNGSNRLVAVRLEGHDSEEGLEFRTDPEGAFSVPAGAERAATMRVRPKKRETIGAPHPYDIEFRGTLTGAASGDAAAEAGLLRQGRYTYTPPITALAVPLWLRRLPGWALILGLLAIILLLLLAGQTASAALGRARGPNVGATQTAVAQAVATARAGVAARLTAQAGAAATAQAQANAQATAAAAARATLVAQARQRQAALKKGLFPRVASFTVQNGARGVVLSWVVQHASRVLLDGHAVAAHGRRGVTIKKATTFTLTAQGPGGTVAQVLRVLPTPGGKVTVGLPARVALPVVEQFAPTIDASAGTSSLVWRVRGAHMVTINASRVAENGSKKIDPRENKTYILVATNAGGSVTTRVVVRAPGGSASGTGGSYTLHPPTIASFTLAHDRAGQPYRLTWRTNGATSVTLDGQSVATNGSQSLVSPLQSATYQLIASNGDGSATAQVQVVVAAATGSDRTFALAPPSIILFAPHSANGALTVAWRVDNATRVTIQGKTVASSGQEPIPPGTTDVRLVAQNDVGSVQATLHLTGTVSTGNGTPTPTVTPLGSSTPTGTGNPSMNSETVTPTPTSLSSGSTPTPLTGPQNPVLNPTSTPVTGPRNPVLNPTPTRTPRVRGPRNPVVNPRTPTATATRTATATATQTPRPTATQPGRPAPTRTPRATATRTPRATPTRTPHATPARTPRATPTRVSRRTPTPRSGRVVTIIGTPTPTRTAVSVPSATSTATASPASVTPTVTPTPPVSGATTATPIGNGGATATPTPTAVIPPHLTINPTTLDFGNQAVGRTSAPQTVTVRNDGPDALAISASLGGVAPGDYSIAANTCNGASVASGATCSISVTFHPLTDGSRGASLTVDGAPAIASSAARLRSALRLADAAPAVSGSVTLNGVGIRGSLAFTPPSLDFGAQLQDTVSATKTITVTNGGAAPVTISSVVGDNPFQYTESDSCAGATLAPGDACTIDVSFSPIATGTITGTLYLYDDASGSPQTVSLTGNGVNPRAFASPNTLDFGLQPIGTRGATQAVTVTNVGTTALTINSVLPSDPINYDETNTCTGQPIAPGGTCTIDVSFTPSITGSIPASILIYDDAPDSPQQITLAGTGTRPRVSVSTGSVNLPFPCGSSFDQGDFPAASCTSETIAVTNTGDSPVNFGNPGLAGPNPGDFTIAGSTCTGALAVGQACAITVTLNTATVTTAYSDTARYSGQATLLINDDATDTAGNSPQQVALNWPLLLVTPGSIDFGTQAIDTASLTQTVTVTNISTQPITISTDFIVGGEGSDFAIVSDTCGGRFLTGVATRGTLAEGADVSLPAGGSCTIGLQFRPFPFAGSGPQSDALLINDDSIDGPFKFVTLRGNAIAPSVALSTGTLDFGQQRVGTSGVTQTVTLTNTGDAPLTVTYVSPDDTADYTEAGTCIARSPIAPNGTCTVDVAFRPGSSGAHPATLYMYDNALDSPQTVALTGTGVQPAASFSPSALNLPYPCNVLAFSEAPPPLCVTTPIVVQSTGATPLTVGTPTLSGPDAGDFSIAGSTCGGSYAPGDSCLITVTLSIPAVSAAYDGGRDSGTATLNVPNDGGGAQSVPLAWPLLLATPASLNFGDQPFGTTSATQTVTVTNFSTQPITITGVSLQSFPYSSYILSSTGCAVTPLTLAPGAACTVDVSFNPQAGFAGPGAVDDTLVIDNDSTENPKYIALSGNATAPIATLSTGTLDFGTPIVGEPGVTQTVTLTNTGTAPLTVTNITVDDTADYTQVNTCLAASPLAPNAACTADVTFMPATVGAHPATLSIDDNSISGSPQTVALTGTGQSGTIFFAALTGNDGNNCLSVATACRHVQAAIDKAPAGGTVIVEPGTYTENITVTNDLTVTGSGADQTFLDGSNSGTVVTTSGGTVLIEALTVQHGNTTGNGGGIANVGATLTVSDTTVFSNTAALEGGGIYVTRDAQLTLTNSRVTNNTAANAGGGVAILDAATATISGGVVSGNAVTVTVASDGGGIYSRGNLAVSDETVTGNSAPSDGDGGGIANDGGGTMALTNTVVSNNSAGFGGAFLNNFGSVTLTRSTVENNTAANGGGGFWNGGSLTLEGSAVMTNTTTGGNGGAIANVGSGSVTGNVTARDSTMSGNTAGGNGAGISVDDGSALQLINSTMSGNQTTFGNGGAVDVISGTAAIASSTIVSNTAGDGGGIYVDAFDVSANPTLHDTILAANQGASGGETDCAYGGDVNVTSQGYNLIGSNGTGCVTTQSSDIVGTFTAPLNPNIGPLQDNGGPTLTHALLAGSPAINAGDPAGCTDTSGVVLTTDQRGAPRPFPVGAPCDIGAYEFGATAPPPPTSAIATTGTRSAALVDSSARAHLATMGTLAHLVDGSARAHLAATSALVSLTDRSISGLGEQMAYRRWQRQQTLHLAVSRLLARREADVLVKERVPALHGHSIVSIFDKVGHKVLSHRAGLKTLSHRVGQAMSRHHQPAKRRAELPLFAIWMRQQRGV